MLVFECNSLIWVFRYPMAEEKLHGLRMHIVALVAAALLPAVAVGAIAVWAAVGSYQQAFDDRLQGTAKALATAVETEIAAHVLALSTLATAQELDHVSSLAAFQARAQQVASLLGTRLFLMAPDCSLVLHTQFALGATDFIRLQTEAVDIISKVFVTGQPAVGHLLTGHVTGRWIAPIYVPVSRDGKTIYALGVALEAERISRMLAGQNFQDDGYASLMDGNGRIVSRSTKFEQYIGQTVPDWVTDGARAAEAGILRGTNRAGVPIVTAFRRVPGTRGWFITVAEPLSTYYASLRRPLALLTLGGFGALGLALAVALRIGGRVLRPVDWLTRKAERVAATGGAADIVPQGPRVRVREFERLRAAVLQAHVALQERALLVAAGEARLRAILDTAADAIVVTDDCGTMLSFNRAAEAIFGYVASETIGQTLATLFDADHIAQHGHDLAAYLHTAETQSTGVGHEIDGRRKDGLTIPLDLTLAEWRDAEGKRFFTAIMRDISTRKAAEARQNILVREVDHRAKNILAVVQSVLRLTPRDQPGAFAAAEERITGLARVHSLLAEGGWLGADLRLLATRELTPFSPSGDAGGSPTVCLSGPPVSLAASAVQPVAMVLHELATNAAKHGALSAPGGRVEVHWVLAQAAGEDGMLKVRWVEAGGPHVAGPPARRGFGTRVVEATVRGQLGGTLERRWAKSGLTVEITVPLVRVLSSAKGTQIAGHGTANRANAA